MTTIMDFMMEMLVSPNGPGFRAELRRCPHLFAMGTTRREAAENLNIRIKRILDEAK